MIEISVKNLSIEWVLGSSAEQAAQLWQITRSSLIVPILRISLYICVVMSTMLSVEWIFLSTASIFARIFQKKPEKRYKWEPMKDDSEIGNEGFPMVLVQIPMFNEKEVYKISIGAACSLSWPANRLVIQVLDDSTDHVLKEMVEKECIRWEKQGINIRSQFRETRRGYKAGALQEGMKQDYVKECEYVVIFDADFRPEPDFLHRAVPFLIHNPDVALVQARWRFVNADECLLTRMQEMTLDYGFRAEQEVGSAIYAFFAFNGSAGIWRISAINDAGGWDDRTTVEDLDLAVRAGCNAWKFIYLGDLQVKCELPSALKAFRLQQHRWSCGPVNLFKHVALNVATSKKMSIWKKIHIIYSIFFVRKIVAYTCLFFSYCVVLPFTILIPEVDAPKAGAVIGTCLVTAINSISTNPRSLHLIFVWILFENVMSFHRIKAIFIGLLGTKSVNEWVVTEKIGDKTHQESSSFALMAWFKVVGDRILLQELGFAVFFFICGCYGFLYGKDYYFIFLFLEAIAFTVVGFGFVGKIV